MRRCRALLFPGVEDFGIVTIEVMASGRPVIAYGYGGVLDSVEPGDVGRLLSGAKRGRALWGDIGFLTR
jgi:glycosyltransferase involved in cell wall biosynthesis